MSRVHTYKKVGGGNKSCYILHSHGKTMSKQPIPALKSNMMQSFRTTTIHVNVCSQASNAHKHSLL